MMDIIDPAIKRLFIVTGDVSGDIHAANVVRALRRIQPEITVHGVGGKAMADAGVHCISDQAKMGFIGIAGLREIWYHLKLGQKILDHLKTFQPDGVLLVDYGGFNLRLAPQLKKRGFKVFYFIPPQVWASRPKRIQTIKHAVDHVFCIFPFEEPLYQSNGIPVTYVGHPLKGHLPPGVDRQTFCQTHQIDPQRTLIGVLPGSRRSEISQLLPVCLEACHQIQTHFSKPVTFLVGQSSAIPSQWYQEVLTHQTLKAKLEALDVRFLVGKTHAIQSVSDAVICKSGTATLETALYETPMVIIYKIHPWLACYVRWVSMLPVVGLPNILTDPQNPPVPECLQERCTPEIISSEILNLLNPGSSGRQTMLAAFKTIGQTLDRPPMDDTIAEKLLALLTNE